ncbi:hypothetical protein BKA70DRAFT_1128324 [Coprinopsis sp. MPI-PUGE-AT-0042]|nr:hypothetical protein BKA70DRAFT_1128324 [Coprinopsis sp. MPI-PUGE-AT-0042]
MSSPSKSHSELTEHENPALDPHFWNPPSPGSWFSPTPEPPEPLPTPHELFANALLLYEIASYSCWRNLVAFSAVSKAFREAAQRDARTRLLWAVGDVLKAFSIDPSYFLLVLECCGGAVVGTTAHRALMLGMRRSEPGTGVGDVYDDIPPAKRLSVIVPDGKRNLFLEMGFRRLGRRRDVLCLRSTRTRARVESEPLLPRSVPALTPEQLYFMRVVESRGSVMLALSNSSTTGDMIAFSHDRLYILYPHLSLNNLAIVRWTRREHFDVNDRDRPAHPKEQDQIQPWPVKCKSSCPTLWRKAREGQGIIQFFWNGSRERGVIEQVGVAKKLGYVTECSEGYVPCGRSVPCPVVSKTFRMDCLLEGEECTFKWRISSVCPNHTGA